MANVKKFSTPKRRLVFERYSLDKNKNRHKRCIRDHYFNHAVSLCGVVCVLFVCVWKRRFVHTWNCMTSEIHGFIFCLSPNLHGRLSVCSLLLDYLSIKIYHFVCFSSRQNVCFDLFLQVSLIIPNYSSKKLAKQLQYNTPVNDVFCSAVLPVHVFVEKDFIDRFIHQGSVFVSSCLK